MLISLCKIRVLSLIFPLVFALHSSSHSEISFTENLIDDDFDAAGLYACDFDGDEDMDVFGAGINSGIASGDGDATAIIVMFTLVALLIVVNLIVEFGLIRGRQTRTKLLNGLLKMYKDQGVADYYDQSLLSDYRTRYNLFMFGVLFIGVVALVIPFILLAT